MTKDVLIKRCAAVLVVAFSMGVGIGTTLPTAQAKQSQAIEAREQSLEPIVVYELSGDTLPELLVDGVSQPIESNSVHKLEDGSTYQLKLGDKVHELEGVGYVTTRVAIEPVMREVRLANGDRQITRDLVRKLKVYIGERDEVIALAATRV